MSNTWKEVPVLTCPGAKYKVQHFDTYVIINREYKRDIGPVIDAYFRRGHFTKKMFERTVMFLLYKEISGKEDFFIHDDKRYRDVYYSTLEKTGDIDTALDAYLFTKELAEV